jgi:hypothetical protein
MGLLDRLGIGGSKDEREARAVAKIVHPNVLTVFDLGYHSDGSPYIAMELLKGKDLLQVMRQDPPMSLPRKLTVILQVLEGLAQAHQVGIVHRDIKPANVFLTLDGTVKITDFGVARFTMANVTGTGAVMGTAEYMSPEQVQGARVDGRSDLWSAGCMLYELLTGRRPFSADNLMTVFYKITHQEPVLDLPAGPEYEVLVPTLRKALARDVDQRFQTAAEFSAALGANLERVRALSAAASPAAGAAEIVGAPSAPIVPGPGETTVELPAAPVEAAPSAPTPAQVAAPGAAEAGPGAEVAAADGVAALDGGAAAQGVAAAPEVAAGAVAAPDEVDPELRYRHDRVPRTMTVPAIALAAAGLLVSLVPDLRDTLLEAGARFVDRSAYAATVLHGATGQHFEVESIEPSVGNVLTGLLTVALACYFAGAALFRERMPGSLVWTETLGTRVLEGLRTLHTSHVGDYVTWLTLGTTTLAAIFALTLTT